MPNPNPATEITKENTMFTLEKGLHGGWYIMYPELSAESGKACLANYRSETHARLSLKFLNSLRETANRWTDDELYEAYLHGCEDECIPEPRTKEAFISEWEYPRTGGVASGE